MRRTPYKHKPMSSSEAVQRRREIREFARQVAEEFHPDRIILFGSHAYGVPHADSDVDVLVVMPARNPISQAVKIRFALPAPFPLDLLVRSPEMVAQRIERNDAFMREIITQGKVLYEKGNRSVGSQSRRRLSPRRVDRESKRAIP